MCNRACNSVQGRCRPSCGGEGDTVDEADGCFTTALARHATQPMFAAPEGLEGTSQS